MPTVANQVNCVCVSACVFVCDFDGNFKVRKTAIRFILLSHSLQLPKAKLHWKAKWKKRSVQLPYVLLGLTDILGTQGCHFENPNMIHKHECTTFLLYIFEFPTANNNCWASDMPRHVTSWLSIWPFNW